jgi:hypothetical protein
VTDLDDRPTAADLYDGPDLPFVGIVQLGDIPGETYGWECGRCDAASGLAWGDADRAREDLAKHDCQAEGACPECPVGTVEDVGRPERETGHQPYACNASCGYYG